jgi:hypothetical protein
MAVVLLRRRRCRLSIAPGKLRSSTVADGDQQSGYVFAVLIGFLESRAGAARSDALTAQAYGDGIRVRVGALDLSGGVRVSYGNVFDDLAFFVVEAAQKRAGSEQSTETAIGKS